MRTQMEKAEAFRALHARPGAFIIPNPWDGGTARLLAAMGFEALATTSLGLANTLRPSESPVQIAVPYVVGNGLSRQSELKLPIPSRP